MKQVIFFLVILMFISNVTAQIPQQPAVDFEIYYGYEWGAAGIASTLIKAKNLISVQDGLNSSIENAVDFLINHRLQYQGKQFFAWEKGPNLQTGIYPGIKYGAAGIVNFLVEAYLYLGNDSYLDFSMKSMQELMNEAIDNTSKPHWGYSYGTPSSNEGIALTGLSFGSAGMIKAAISVYKATGDEQYLQWAQKMFDWIASISTEKEKDMISVPWYSHVAGFASVEIYEYSRGMAGIAPHLMELGKFLNNQTIQGFAISVGNYLVNVQKNDGSWPVQNDTEVSTPYLATGTAGIIKGLYMTDPLTFENSIKKGIENLLSKLKNGVINEEQPLNSLYEGTLGVYQSLFALQNLMDTEQKSKLNQEFNQFLTTQLVKAQLDGSEYLLLKPNPTTVSRFDLSLGSGLAGLVHMLSEQNLDPSIDISGKKISVLQKTTETLIALQNLNGSWNRQVILPGFIIVSNSVEETPIQIAGAIVAIPILLRKIKNQKS